jgi:hypothetical protein
MTSTTNIGARADPSCVAVHFPSTFEEKNDHTEQGIVERRDRSLLNATFIVAMSIGPFCMRTCHDKVWDLFRFFAKMARINDCSIFGESTGNWP